MLKYGLSKEEVHCNLSRHHFLELCHVSNTHPLIYNLLTSLTSQSVIMEEPKNDNFTERMSLRLIITATKIATGKPPSALCSVFLTV